MSGYARFPLAPMDRLITALTWVLLAVPLIFVLAAARTRQPPLALVAGLLALLYLGVYLYMRPTRFEITPRDLILRWPIRQETIARSDVVAANVLSSAEARARLGLAIRVGVGGLWGGFGLLLTRGAGTVRMYLSRTGPLVLVELRNRRPLLISPSRPHEFVRALRG